MRSIVIPVSVASIVTLLLGCGIENKARTTEPVKDDNAALAVSELRQMADSVPIGSKCRVAEQGEGSTPSVSRWEIRKDDSAPIQFTIDTQSSPRAPAAKREERSGVPYWRIDLDAAPADGAPLAMSWEVREDSAATTAFSLRNASVSILSLSDCL